MALAGTDLYLVNRGGVDYQVAFDRIKEDILSAVPEYELEGNLIYRGAVDNEAALPGDAEVGSIYSAGLDYHVMTPDGWFLMGQVEEVDLSGYAKTEDIPTDNAQLSNGAGYITKGEGAAALADYLKSGDNVTELNNDAGYLTEAEVGNILQGNHPDGTDNGASSGYLKPGDNVGELHNDAGYITAALAPVQSVDGKTRDVDLSSSYLPMDISSLPELPSA